MNSLPLKTIMQRYRDKLRDSTAISSWCQSNFGKPVTIYVGFNAKNPPPLSKCPSIVIFQGEKTEGDGADTLGYSVGVSWSIENEAVTETGNIVEYPGLYQADDLGQLILKEIAAASDNAEIANVDYGLEGFTHYPQFPGRMDVTIQIPNVIGSATILF